MAAASSRGRTVRWRAVGNSAARAASHGARLLSGDPNVAEDAHQEVRPDSSTLRTCQICSLSKSRQPTPLLNANPFALLVGMLLDQQVPMETAFAGPKKIADRMGSFDAGDIADYDPDKFVALCSERPAIHRFPGSMAKRIQALAQIIVDRYDGDAAALWTAGEPDGNELLRRLKGLPGFGEQKARIFLALLGKQYGVTPKGWQVAAGEFGQPGTYLSVADIVDAGSLGQVRSHKRQRKAAAKAEGKAPT